MLINPSNKFTQALQLAQQGKTQQSLKLFTELTNNLNNDYSSIVNYGVLCIQQAKLKQAREAFTKAISIDCYQYLAYYNLFIAGCHELERIKVGVEGIKEKEYQQRKRDNLYNLYFTLSCLYAELGEIQKDIKLCSKALYYSQQNSIAYINRAMLYQRDNKLKLAENDYSSAIYYDPDNLSFYMKRAQFYWKNNNITESNNDLKIYLQKKTNLTQSLSLRQSVKFLKCSEISQVEVTEYDNIIQEKCLELYNLLSRISAANQKKQENWVFNIPASPRSAEKIANLEKIINFQHLEDFDDADSNAYKDSNQSSEIQPYKWDIKVSNNQKQIHNESSDAYADESSKNISQQIQKLQKQIRLQRGKVSQQSQQQSSQNIKQQIFLTAQIQKTNKQIETIKNKQISDVKSASSMGSHYSDRILSVDDLKHYTKIVLEVVSAQFFNSSNKEQSKIYITYGRQRAQTQYSKTLFWRQKVQLNIEHNLHKNFKSALQSSSELDYDDFTRNVQGDIVLELEMKSKSIWSSKRIIGKGSINILFMGENKCILSNQKQKTGIIYFKLKIV